MNKPFDPLKPVQTRDGRKARIICTDRKMDGFPILALIPSHSGHMEHCYCFSWLSSTSRNASSGRCG